MDVNDARTIVTRARDEYLMKLRGVAKTLRAADADADAADVIALAQDVDVPGVPTQRVAEDVQGTNIVLDDQTVAADNV